MTQQRNDSNRQVAYTAMKPRTRAIADRFEQNATKSQVALVIANYDLGADLLKIAADEAGYGTEALAQLAEYLGVEKTVTRGIARLSNYRRWAEVYNRKVVASYTNKTLPDGQHITTRHWLVLCQVGRADARQRYLDQTFEHGWSSRQLETMIDAAATVKSTRAQGGGRAPAKLSPTMSVQKVIKMMETLDRWANSKAYDSFLTQARKLDGATVEPRLRHLVEEAKVVLSKGTLAIERLTTDMRWLGERLIINEPAEEVAEAVEPEATKTAKPEKAVKPAAKVAVKATKPVAVNGHTNGHPTNGHSPARRPAATGKSPRRRPPARRALMDA